MLTVYKVKLVIRRSQLGSKKIAGKNISFPVIY